MRNPGREKMVLSVEGYIPLCEERCKEKTET